MEQLLSTARGAATKVSPPVQAFVDSALGLPAAHAGSRRSVTVAVELMRALGSDVLGKAMSLAPGTAGLAGAAASVSAVTRSRVPELLRLLESAALGASLSPADVAALSAAPLPLSALERVRRCRCPLGAHPPSIAAPPPPSIAAPPPPSIAAQTAPLAGPLTSRVADCAASFCRGGGVKRDFSFRCEMTKP